MARARMVFPPDFRWGTATASHQVEGNNQNSDWWLWEQGEGNILHGHQSGLACDWWRNAEADLDRAVEMGTNAHRFSLEWSRIEPEPSLFDETALERYRAILSAMHQRGIEPMVTLHHFSNPLWLVEKGDFNAELVAEYFQRYVAKAVDVFGDLVPKWITINEPLVYIFNRYIRQVFPAPQEAGWGAARKGLRNLLRCHAIAYHTIKEKQPTAQVGFAKNLGVFEPRPGGNWLDSWLAGRVSWLFNEMWMDSVEDGHLRWPVGTGAVKHLAGSFDFVGVNYYTRYCVKFPPRGDFFMDNWGPDAVISDGRFGELFPQGMYQVIRRVLRHNKPIYITENGLPDQVDALRPSYLLTHLREIWRAISFCFPVMGYYHWSLVDNFEWNNGWSQRFGLIAMDPQTQERKWRASGYLYRDICQSNSISSEMAEKYAPELMDTMFPGNHPERGPTGSVYNKIPS